MYAVHLRPEGSSYTGTKEEFMTATPLPLTDAIINPHDGAMYFLIGGRGTQSGLYRLTYAGKESTAPAVAHQPGIRRAGDPPRARNAARRRPCRRGGKGLALFETFRPIHPLAPPARRLSTDRWKRGRSAPLPESDPQASLTALLALVRKVPRSFKPTGPDLDTPPPAFPANDAVRHPLQAPVLAALAKLDWSKLSQEQRIELLRVYELALYRLGPPDEAARDQLIARLDGFYPADDRPMNVLLTELLCYLQAPSAAKKGMELLAVAPAQEEQINFVKSLRFLKTGWTLELHRELFQWFVRAQAYRGGNNFPTFMQELRNDCLANTSADERKALDELINSKPAQDGVAVQPRPFVKEWKMEEVIPLIAGKLKDRDFAHGKAMFAAANCYACHHFAGDGGAVGPDLTGLAGRFSPRDILESVLEPDKVISDQYAAMEITTSSGKTVVGRITNYGGGEVTVNTNMQDPNATVSVKSGEIESMTPSKTSMMPSALLNTLHEEELLDLMAFLLSRGDSHNPMFGQKAASAGEGTSTATDSNSLQGN